MQISPQLNIPFYGTMSNNKTKEKQDFSEQKTNTFPDKTLTVARNTLLAGMLGLLTNCTSMPSSISTQTPNEPNLPSDLYYQISRTKQGNGVYIDIVDGQKYTVKYTDKGYTVTCPDGSVKTFDYDKRCGTMTTSQRSEMIDLLEKQNGLVLADLATEVTELRYFWGPMLKGYYNAPYERISTDPIYLHHELGHAMDYHRPNGQGFIRHGNNKHFADTVEREHAALKEVSDRTKADNLRMYGDMNSNSEIFAECAGIIMSGGNFDRNRAVFEKYFPKTLVLTRQYLDKTHKLPQTVRNPFIGQTTKLPDGKVECVITDQQGRKIKKTIYDPQKWPAIIDAYQAKFNANGEITEEIITRPIKYTMDVSRHTHRRLDPTTGRVISETTKKGFIPPKYL